MFCLACYLINFSVISHCDRMSSSLSSIKEHKQVTSDLKKCAINCCINCFANQPYPYHITEFTVTI